VDNNIIKDLSTLLTLVTLAHFSHLLFTDFWMYNQNSQLRADYIPDEKEAKKL